MLNFFAFQNVKSKNISWRGISERHYTHFVQDMKVSTYQFFNGPFVRLDK
jgi:hypothetical protein